ncbi:hypothetical protein M9H77_01299 [Catharanthus roseus]|uniref:Uncharacterized protein n=1 Tax=Catharanthus roseus TaxID=4058 RepID=A0ACC0C5D0_CATRO|nr:hypothetical protein M9H77_01299 [Catharanthus roseus]
MAGQGGVENRRWDHVVPPECQASPKIQKLNASLQWEEAKEPLHDGIDTRAVEGVGPGIPFAHTLLQRNPKSEIIGLVPCAISATRILQWQKGQLLYNQLLTRAQAAARSGTIHALLWYQGESDTDTVPNAQAYKRRLQRFINDIRADLHLPNLLIIVVALASGVGPGFEIVRQTQLNLNLQNIRVVDAKGLGLKSDHLHLSTASQVILGKKLADAFLYHP